MSEKKVAMKSIYTKLIDMAVKEMATDMAARITDALRTVNTTGEKASVVVPRKPFQDLLKRVREMEGKK